MKYFLDTEFIERPGTIELISIGIVCEDGRTFYAESTCFDERKASEWVKENVISKLRWHGNENSTKGFCNAGTQFAGTPEEKTEVFGTLDLISQTVKDFIESGLESESDKPEFWSWYADYDWVIFCWLFGTMMDLPKGYPMYCRDIQQLIDEKGSPKPPKQKGIEHDALADAIYHKDLYSWVTKLTDEYSDYDYDLAN